MTINAKKILGEHYGAYQKFKKETNKQQSYFSNIKALPGALDENNDNRPLPSNQKTSYWQNINKLPGIGGSLSKGIQPSNNQNTSNTTTKPLANSNNSSWVNIKELYQTENNNKQYNDFWSIKKTPTKAKKDPQSSFVALKQKSPWDNNTQTTPSWGDLRDSRQQDTINSQAYNDFWGIESQSTKSGEVQEPSYSFA